MSVDVHHLVDGPVSGEVVIFSGSLGSDLRMWEPQVEPLAEAGLRVVRYDHRGHGDSPVVPGPYALEELGADVLALIDRLGVCRVHFVGLSLGGMLGMWLGQHAADRIASLTLCCTSAALGPAEMWSDRAKLVREKGVPAVADAVVERWFTEEWRAANPELTGYYRDMIAATPAEGYASCCTAIEKMNLVPGLSSITAPALVIAGAQDPATPPEHGKQIAAAISGARLEVVESAAHLASVEQADEVSRLIIEQIKRIA
ncbi:MAG: 3-oxoadipate enol-lactonase [Pseudonocardiaceae bacterium]